MEFYITSSQGGIYGSEQQLGTDISSMTNDIQSALNTWAVEHQGVAFTAEDDQDKINIGFKNCVGPRILIAFIGEDKDDDMSELTGRVRRNFDIIITRGKLLSDPRNSALTKNQGPVKKFYQLVEGARDVVRNMIFPQPMVYNPPIYNGIRPNNQGQWLMDSYVINFSVLCQIPRSTSIYPQLASNPLSPPWTAVTDPLPFLQNTLP